jgi:hypothetical protein
VQRFVADFYFAVQSQNFGQYIGGGRFGIGFIFSRHHKDTVDRPISDNTQVGTAASPGSDTGDKCGIDTAIFKGTVDIAGSISPVSDRLLDLRIGQRTLQKKLKGQEIEITDRAKDHAMPFWQNYSRSKHDYREELL